MPDRAAVAARGPSPVPGLAAVLLDLDGTLADTEPLWRVLYHELADLLGVRLSDGWWSQVVGRSLGSSVEVLAGRHAADPEQRDRVVDWLVERGAERLRAASDHPHDHALVSWRPGARRLVDTLHLAGVPTAVVTTSPRRLLDVVGDHLELQPTASIAGDEVERSKPDPDGYHRAATLLGVEITDCVAVEDSPTGVRAAEASGARVLAVPSSVALATTATRTIVASLAEVDVATLAALPRRA